MFKCILCGYEGKANVHLCLDAPSLRKYYVAKLHQRNVQIADLKQQVKELKDKIAQDLTEYVHCHICGNSLVCPKHGTLGTRNA